MVHLDLQRVMASLPDSGTEFRFIHGQEILVCQFLIVVFDAYKIKKNIGSIEKNDNIYVVYTKEAQTADNYIEKVTHDLSQKYRVYVATSDALEQIIVSSRGAMRISAREFELLVKETHLHEIEEFQRKNKQMKNYLLEDLKKN